VRAYEGLLGFRDAERLFEDLIGTAVEQLPSPPFDGGRADLLRGMLREDPACSLGELARALKLSYTGTSRVFSQTIGLPLRTYRQWLKCMRATEQLHADVPLTKIACDAGFADSAHLSHTWQRSFGLSPSYIRDDKHVRLILGTGRPGRDAAGAASAPGSSVPMGRGAHARQSVLRLAEAVR
jgi:AraC-like DNA-binding protein